MTARLDWLRRNAAPQALAAVRRNEGALCEFPEDDGEAFAAIVMCDPSPRQSYVAWMLKILARGGLRSEDLPRAMETLSLFHYGKHRLPPEARDIGRYASEPDLHAVVAGAPSAGSMVEIPDEIRERTRILYEGPEGCVAVPLDLMSSKWWGKGTRWCTTQASNFQSYTAQGPLYVVVDADGTRHQVHGPSRQFCDSQDRTLPFGRIVLWADSRPWAVQAEEVRVAIWSSMVHSAESRLPAETDATSPAFIRFIALLGSEQVKASFEGARAGQACEMRALVCMPAKQGADVSPSRPAGIGSDNLDRIMLDAAPLHFALGSNLRPDLVLRAKERPEVVSFLSGVSEEPAAGNDVRVFAVRTEEAARAWSAMHPEYPTASMVKAFRSGAPLHVLVGSGTRLFEIAMATLSCVDTPDGGLSRLDWLVSELDLDEPPANAVGTALPEDAAARARLLVERFYDTSFLWNWDGDRNVSGSVTDRFMKATLDRVAEAETDTVASHPSGWSVRAPRTRFAAIVMRLQAPASYGPPKDRVRLAEIHDGLFADRYRHYRARWDEAQVLSDVCPEVADFTVVEVRDADGTRWLLDRGRIGRAEASGPPRFVPMLPNPGVPIQAARQLVGGDLDKEARVSRDWGKLPAPHAPEAFLAARPWLADAPGLPMLMAAAVGLRGFRKTARAIAGKPGPREMLAAARTDPLSVLCGTFGVPSPAVREAALDASRWGRIVLDGQPLVVMVDGVAAELPLSRQGVGWKAFRCDGVPSVVPDGVLRPAEQAKFRSMPAVLPIEDGVPPESRLRGELTLSIRSGVTFLLSDCIGLRLFHFTPGLDDLEILQRMDPECFGGGIARLFSLRHLAFSADPGAVLRHPFLHLDEGGLRPEDLVDLHLKARFVGGPLIPRRLFKMLLALPEPPLDMIREAMRQRPGILVDIENPPRCLVQAAAEDFAGHMTRPDASGRSLLEERYGTGSKAVGRFLSDCRMVSGGAVIGRFCDIVTRYIQDHRSRDFIASMAPVNRPYLADAIERCVAGGQEPDGPVAALPGFR
jgi:hypothetical protein